MPVAKLLAPPRASSRLVALTPLLALTLCAGITNSARAQGADYTFTTLDDPAGTATDISGINNLGQVVGSYSAGGLNHGFLYTDGAYMTLDDPLATGGTSPGTTANGLNDAGEVVGFYQAANGNTDGFLYTPTGGFTTVNDPLAVGDSEIYGINNSGEIAGVYYDANNKGHGFLAMPSAVPAVPETSPIALLALGLLPVGALAARKKNAP